MSQTAHADGQNPGQSAPEGGGEGDAKGDESRSGGEIEDLKAQVGMLTDSLYEMRDALVKSRQAAPVQAETDDDDDDEPLKASKVRKIVHQAVSVSAQQNTAKLEQAKWDDRAKSEFPIADPKFQMELKKVWNEQVNSGMDPRHPKAMYNVAKITADRVGVKKPAAKPDPETTHNSEAPSNNPSTRPQARTGASRTQSAAVNDSDPRLRFYTMKGDRSKEQIEAMKKRLGERDAARRSR